MPCECGWALQVKIELAVGRRRSSCETAKSFHPHHRHHMVALPSELLQLVFSFIWQRKDATACTLVCKTWNTFATIRLYEAGVKLEALRTLWMRPDLAALVKDVRLAWEHRSTFELDMDMDDSELLDILKDEKTVHALREGYTSAYAVLLIKLLPSLRTLDITPFDAFLFQDVFPTTDTFCDPSRIRTLRHLTSLQVTGYNGGMGNYHGLTLSLLVRCMALPSLKFLTFQVIDGMKPWGHDIQQVLPNLYGTSSVEHLRLQQAMLVTDDFLVPLLRIPHRLRTFGLADFKSHDAVALKVINDALHHVQHSLEVLEVYHAEFSPLGPIDQRRLMNLRQFPLLTHLTAPMTYVTGSTQKSNDPPAFRDLLPPSLIFWNIRMDGRLLSDLTKRRPLFIEGLIRLPSLKQLCIINDWYLSAEVKKKMGDADVELTYDHYDRKQHIIMYEDQWPIFEPSDWRNLGGCYGSPVMDEATDDQDQD
jgi:hypothetical protein